MFIKGILCLSIGFHEQSLIFQCATLCTCVPVEPDLMLINRLDINLQNDNANELTCRLSVNHPVNGMAICKGLPWSP